jgi:hypothetical protein
MSDEEEFLKLTEEISQQCVDIPEEHLVSVLPLLCERLTAAMSAEILAASLLAERMATIFRRRQEDFGTGSKLSSNGTSTSHWLPAASRDARPAWGDPRAASKGVRALSGRRSIQGVRWPLLRSAARAMMMKRMMSTTPRARRPSTLSRSVRSARAEAASERGNM